MLVRCIKINYCLVIVFLLFSSILSLAQTGRVIGTVTDQESGEPLFGANIILLNSGNGGSTDINGWYSIFNLPLGEHTLRISYLGYKSQETKISVTSGKTIEVNFSLASETLEGETVLITAQREGQIAAINQQISSDAIKNIVSSDKIEELPEANAAEAVGRLPGVSLQREGGEGNKVVIRGLAPKYNKVQINGVDMASTDAFDRSTDLSMISPNMLEGIEVTKSAMADQEANQLGGTVNFLLKSAPYAEPSYKVIIEGGHNALRSEYKDYRLVAQTNRRLFDNLLGVSLNLDIENRNRSSNTVSSDYKYLQQDQYAVVNSLHIEDITRDLERFNTSLLFDYKTQNTDIKFINMFSRAKRNNVSRREDSNDLFGSSNRTQYLSSSEKIQTILMHQFTVEQYISDIKIDLGLSYSYADDEMPEELGYGGLEASPLGINGLPAHVKPANVPNYMKNDITAITLTGFNDSESITKEDEFGAHLNLDWEYTLSSDINIKLRLGTKYKHKYRKHDFNTIFLNISTDPSAIVNEAIMLKWPWMAAYATGGSFRYEPFIDNNYDPGDFMQGEYNLERVPDLKLGEELLHYLQDYLGVETGGTSQAPQRFVPNFHTSTMDDYNGTEDYLAAFVMPTISIGTQFTLIPGIRFEKNKTVYTGIRGDGSQNAPSYRYIHHKQKVTRENEFFLPMIHARYKPFNWFDVRASYTQTLSRPSYIEFLPSWNIYGPPLGIDYRNPNLRPAKSDNYDLYFSFYGNKVGLFTVGLFAKNIDDLIFPESKIILSDTMAVEEFGLAEEETLKDPNSFKGSRIFSYVNNPYEVKVNGVELEWQSNLWYLPGLLKNIVFGINYTYTFSETKYPRTVPIKEIVSSPFGNREVIVGNEDVPYKAPLLYQPKHILNVTLGYDYSGFSIRTSVQFKSKIFSQNNWRPDLRGYTDDFYIYDLSVSQKLPFEGLVLFGNIKNISKTIESDYNVGTAYMSNKEYYGMSAGLGIKYTF